MFEIEFCDIEGNLSRIEGPAVVTRWRKEWYQNHKLHRVGGPAVERVTGRYNQWWINDVQYTEVDYWQHPDVVAHKANTSKPKEVSTLREIMMKTICNKIADLSDEDFWSLN